MSTCRQVELRRIQIGSHLITSWSGTVWKHPGLSGKWPEMARCVPGPRDQYPLRDLISAEPLGTEAAAEISIDVRCIWRLKSTLLPALLAGSCVFKILPFLSPSLCPRQPSLLTKGHACNGFTLLWHPLSPPTTPLTYVLAEMSWSRHPELHRHRDKS